MGNEDIITIKVILFVVLFFGVALIFLSVYLFKAIRDRNWYRKQLFQEMDCFLIKEVNTNLELFLEVVRFYLKEENMMIDKVISSIRDWGIYSDYCMKETNLLIDLLDQKIVPSDIIQELTRNMALIRDFTIIRIEDSENIVNYEYRRHKVVKILNSLADSKGKLCTLFEKVKEERLKDFSA